MHFPGRPFVCSNGGNRVARLSYHVPWQSCSSGPHLWSDGFVGRWCWSSNWYARGVGIYHRQAMRCLALAIAASWPRYEGSHFLIYRLIWQSYPKPWAKTHSRKGERQRLAPLPEGLYMVYSAAVMVSIRVDWYNNLTLLCLLQAITIRESVR